jgi:hypothetical protein
MVSVEYKCSQFPLFQGGEWSESQKGILHITGFCGGYQIPHEQVETPSQEAKGGLKPLLNNRELFGRYITISSINYVIFSLRRWLRFNRHLI